MATASEILTLMQSRFPRMYNVYDKNTHIYKLLSVYAHRCSDRDNILDRLYKMLDIDETLDEDLEHRWGSLLGIKKMAGEEYEDYRRRLQIVYASFAGGTTEAIKYAIASVIGISSDANMIDQCIHIYDAWEYTGDDIDKSHLTYGHIVCVVDLSIVGMVDNINNTILSSVNGAKSAGVCPHIVLIYVINDVAKIKCNEDSRYHITTQSADNVCISRRGKQGESSALFGFAKFGSAIMGYSDDSCDMYNDVITYVKQ